MRKPPHIAVVVSSVLYGRSLGLPPQAVAVPVRSKTLGHRFDTIIVTEEANRIIHQTGRDIDWYEQAMLTRLEEDGALIVL